MAKLKKTTEQIIDEANIVHNFKYHYSKSVYKGAIVDMCITCLQHGDFWQTPHDHLSGSGCPICGLKSRVRKRTDTIDQFIEKARKIHGDKYDYSKVEYVNNRTKVCIICPIHGEFWQTPDKHINRKQGCPKCARNCKDNKETFIKKAKEIFGDEFDYSDVEYINSQIKVAVGCREHGIFLVTPHNHLLGRGCPMCKNRKISESETKTTEKFVEEAKAVHPNDSVIYDKVKYEGAKVKVCLTCPIHGDFWQTPSSHLQGCGCPKCTGQISKAEEEIKQFIEDNCNVEVLSNRRDIISGGKELDLYIPLMDVAFEYNGMIWHSERFGKDKNYHLKKTEDCLKQGIRLYHIYEYEWLNKKKVVKRKILDILNACDILPKIDSCSCDIRQIKEDAELFFLDNDIENCNRLSSLYIGAFYDGKLVAVLTLRKADNDEWGIIRFASDVRYNIEGIRKKLIDWFIKNYKPNIINTEVDRRWSYGEEYEECNFKLIGILPPTFAYTKSGNEYYTDIAADYKIKVPCYKIWNCGYLKYQWKSKDNT